ncbi:MAG: hypothetical protein ABIJ65_10850 [Chloroflexota bacterium]
MIPMKLAKGSTLEKSYHQSMVTLHGTSRTGGSLVKDAYLAATLPGLW